jgi:hypothetical protein
VSKTGQICIDGQHEYCSVGRACVQQEVVVRFDPPDRHFVFYLPRSEQDDPAQEEPQEIGRHPARNIEVVGPDRACHLARWLGSAVASFAAVL